MSDQHEPLATIFAEARKSLVEDSWIDEITALDEDGEPDDFARKVVPLENAIEAIERIEAAVERERRKYERLHECFWSDGAIQNIVRQLLDERDDLRDQNPKASEVAARFAQLLKKAATRAPGNAAAMREALVKIEKLNHYDLACIRSEKSRRSFDAKILDIELTIRAALAAPARNADRFKTAVETMEEWGKYPQSRYKGCRVCPHGDARMVSPSHLTLAEWLFAPSEGGAK